MGDMKKQIDDIGAELIKLDDAVADRTLKIADLQLNKKSSDILQVRRISEKISDLQIELFDIGRERASLEARRKTLQVLINGGSKSGKY